MYQFVEKPDGQVLHVAVHTPHHGAGCVFYPPGYHSDFDFITHKTTRDWSLDNNTNYVSLEYTAHGQSPGDMDKAGLNQFMRDARFVMNRFCNPEVVGPVTFVGHSIGGWFGILLAEQLARKYPDGVAGVVSIVPTSSLMGPNGYMRGLIDKDPEKFESAGSVASPLGRATRMRYTKWFGRTAERYDLAYKTIRNSETGEIGWIPRAKIDTWHDFKISIVDGEDDVASPRYHMEAFANRLPPGVVSIHTLEAVPNPDPASKYPTLPAYHGMVRDVDQKFILDQVAGFVEAARRPKTRTAYPELVQAVAG